MTNVRDDRVFRLPPELTVRMRSVDGSVYWIVSRSQLDYVLHPVFLKFIFIACALYAVLDRGRDFEPVSPWVYLCLWAIVLVVMLAWLGFCGSIIRYLYDRGLIRQVWTPVMLLPMIIGWVWVLEREE